MSTLVTRSQAEALLSLAEALEQCERLGVHCGAWMAQGTGLVAISLEGNDGLDTDFSGDMVRQFVKDRLPIGETGNGFEGAQARAVRMERCLDDLTSYVNEGCICGRAPNPANPVDPRLLKKQVGASAETAAASVLVGRVVVNAHGLKAISFDDADWEKLPVGASIFTKGGAQ